MLKMNGANRNLLWRFCENALYNAPIAKQDMRHTKHNLQTADGLQLFAQSWEPDSEPEAVVFLIHGLGEHSGRYNHVAEQFNRADIALTAFDLRGHGRSDGIRGHSPHYESLLDDIFQGLENTRHRWPNRPLFLYGQSLGGNLVIHYVLKRRPALAGVIASAPLFRPAFKPPAWKMTFAHTLHALHISVALSNELDPNALSRDPDVVRRYQTDPFVHDRITPQLAVDMLRAGKWNLEHATEFPLPLLLMHGSADRITSAEASSEFAAGAGDTCTLKLWPGLTHELHNEPFTEPLHGNPEKPQVLDVVLDWIKQTSP